MLRIKRFSFFTLFLLISTLSADKIAVATKVKGLVEIMKVGKKEFLSLKAGSILVDGDKIRTGSSGFVAIIFIDDRSILKIKENSILTLNGQRKRGSISKEINLQGGSLRAQVTDQNRKNFTIESSVSVASVKGTDFWFINDYDNGQDFIHGLDGLIELTNKNSGISVDIEAGITGFSNIDGNLQTKKTDPKTLPADEVDPETKTNSIEIEFLDSTGKKKKLIINYR